MIHASDTADQQVVKTSDEEMYSQLIEEVNLVQPAPEWEQSENNGHKLKVQEDSGSSITEVSRESWANLDLSGLT